MNGSGEGRHRRKRGDPSEADIDFSRGDRGRRESGHEHQGKRTTGGSEREEKTENIRRGWASGCIGSRTNGGEGVGCGRHTTGRKGKSGIGWCIHRRRGWRRTCARISRVHPHIDPTPANTLVLAAGGGGVGPREGGPAQGGFAGVQRRTAGESERTNE